MKRTKDNGGFGTEHRGIRGSNFSQHAATSEAAETLGECVDKGSHLTDTVFRK